MRKRWYLGFVLAAFSFGLSASPFAAAQQDPSEERRYREGDLVRDHGVGAVVPRRGMILHAEALTTEGIQEFAIAHLEDGSIVFAHQGDELTESPSGDPGLDDVGSPTECNDSAYTDEPYKWYSTMNWRFNRSTTPVGVTADQAEAAVRGGTQNITQVLNNCGWADYVDASASYQGHTDSTTGIDASGNCISSNNINATWFGDLPASSTYIKLATECTWISVRDGYDAIVESDVKLNKVDANWTVNPGAVECLNMYDIEAVMTHERGHSFGLGHVSEQDHGKLTMSTKLEGRCQASERTLGRGDRLGLENKY